VSQRQVLNVDVLNDSGYGCDDEHCGGHEPPRGVLLHVRSDPRRLM
jgi:hypothetical protein